MRVEQLAFPDSNRFVPDDFIGLLSSGEYEENHMYGNFSHSVDYTLLEFS